MPSSPAKVAPKRAVTEEAKGNGEPSQPTDRSSFSNPKDAVTVQQKAMQRQDVRLKEQFEKLRKEEERFVKQLEEEGDDCLGPLADVQEVRHSVFELQMLCQSIDALKTGEAEGEPTAMRDQMKKYVEEVRKLRMARQRGDKRTGGLMGKAASLASALSKLTGSDAGKVAVSPVAGETPATQEAEDHVKPLAAGRASHGATPPPRLTAAEAKKLKATQQKKRGMWARASAMEVDRPGNGRNTTFGEKLERKIGAGGRRNSLVAALLAASKKSADAWRNHESLPEEQEDEDEDEKDDRRVAEPVPPVVPVRDGRRGSFLSRGLSMTSRGAGGAGGKGRSH
jgi:hypothetical protein